jgi:Uma2 family endonuclease
MSTQALTTIEQFSQMPSDERVRFELVDGELIPVSSGTPVHNKIRDRLLIRIGIYLERNPLGEVLGETDYRTTGDTVRRPDVSFVTVERWQTVDESRIPVPFSPDIAIEVLSPSETAMDLNLKVQEYLASGAQEVWLIDAKTREVMIRTSDGARIVKSTLSSPLLPGFSISIAELLASRATGSQLR